jgi:response regulator of citrate/malate metabolism
VSFGEGCLSHGELIKRGLQKKKDAISRGEVYHARSGRISEGLGGRPALTINDLPSHFVEIYNNHNYKNISDLARKCGMSRTTVYRYIEVLTQ